MNAIEFIDVGKQYGELEALCDIRLSVKKGETLVICGPSGAGKSTLLRALNGLESISRGEIKVFGQPIAKALPEKVAMVFQHFHLFPHLSIVDNLIHAPIRALKLSRRDAIAAAMRVLNQVGIADQADKYPPQLSTGQQQRVAIARSLCMQPDLLLFDEPTSTDTTQEVMKVMTDIAKSDITMVCVTHEIDFARKIADRIVFMDKGKVVEIAPPEQLLTNPQHPKTQHFLEQLLSYQ
ncbi:arginine ABC transporter ATP-binding protein [Vibrio zhanjiangensis]|uniref:Arginine ABC transporter ATP-binding protein n=1 Tax=Vibrio zhanjiangensis TaxID=1046128 RepID=A0ABQ6F0L7_9VIBR|nr:amino acid ABC transporter ATP-binding protein [Vibrio zhanjiangensis]GLT18797.1 arginine ABC transporter ATP-binding protein [Vibrio zhanjiangensis]